jgi:putative DNA methylase
MAKVSYFSNKMPSKGHTSIYKIHKYFARRPHNQFRAMIEHYVPADGVVLDCFAGGGVTLVEGLTVGRRVVSIDVNPVASLVQQGQVLDVSALQINELTTRLSSSILTEIGTWFETQCRQCFESTPYRWIERAYFVNCPKCNSDTLLDEASKFVMPSGSAKNGTYICNHCGTDFQSVSTKRQGSRILSVRYKCRYCNFEEAAVPAAHDFDLNKKVESEESKIIKKFELTIPTDEIPMEWDRQSEDALLRKGFRTFADLFPVRNRIFIAFLLRGLSIEKSRLPSDVHLGALTQISALIRYVNSMTFSTSSWMDGRPVAWAKHAYWTPNQFIEVNPFEYLSHRQLATKKWETDRRSRFEDKIGSLNPMDVIQKTADYAVVCADSRTIPLPDRTVDAVITDPPFGGNVQYGELTHLWQVWLRDSNPFEKNLFELQNEILVHRKNTSNRKTTKHYEIGLREVFSECFRVLKNDCVLSFTFNNKSPDAWFAVMKAAFDAGFILEEAGVHYHEEIAAYRDTAHLRFDGELQGDVLYTFVKCEERAAKIDDIEPLDWLRNYVLKADRSIGKKEQAINLHLAIIRKAAAFIGSGRSEVEAGRWLNLLSIISESNRSGDSIIGTCEDLLNA